MSQLSVSARPAGFDLAALRRAVLSGSPIGALLLKTSMVVPFVLAAALARLGGLIYLPTAPRAQANTPAGRA